MSYKGMAMNVKDRTHLHEDAAVGTSISLKNRLLSVSEKCIRCDLCQKECAFIRKYGKPKDVAEAYDPSIRACLTMPFECSLCGLCTAVCPAKVDPAAMMLEMRRETVRLGEGDYPEHEPLRAYERRGRSRRYSYYGLPQNCDTVFFPGCSLSGTRSHRVIDTFLQIRRVVPSLGIVLDCCSKPSHDLGRQDHFDAVFGEMRQYLLDNGVKRVLVACPNCYKVFGDYGKELSVESVYEVLATHELAELSTSSSVRGSTAPQATIHDPCVARFAEPIMRSVRQLSSARGLVIEEMPHSKQFTVCCGNGGGTGSIAPDFASKWGKIRQKEADARTIVTSCAGCANALSKLNPTVHVLDLLFEPDRALAGKAAVSKPPLTYWKRLRLKKWFRQNVPVAVSRERSFAGLDKRKGHGGIKLLLFLIFLVTAIVAVKWMGASRLSRTAKAVRVAGGLWYPGTSCLCARLHAGSSPLPARTAHHRRRRYPVWTLLGRRLHHHWFHHGSLSRLSRFAGTWRVAGWTNG